LDQSPGITRAVRVIAESAIRSYPHLVKGDHRRHLFLLAAFAFFILVLIALVLIALVLIAAAAAKRDLPHHRLAGVDSRGVRRVGCRSTSKSDGSMVNHSLAWEERRPPSVQTGPAESKRSGSSEAQRRGGH
jgi:cytoskeletal protein RodZ